jgi:RHS repeat-associated protein
VVRGVEFDSGAYDAQDRLVTYGNALYVYTKAGYLQFKITGTDTTSYRYDAYGNLTSVCMPDGILIEYVVDATNRRIGRKVNEIYVARYVYSDYLKPAAMLDSVGNVIERYVYATHENVPEYIVKGDTTYRVITDHLGSVRLVVNASTGEIIQHIDYDEFGDVIFDSNPGLQPFGYAGGLYDQQTKLVRFGARDYDARCGRWTAKDPINFSSGDRNLFLYCANDGINNHDIKGRFIGSVQNQLLTLGTSMVVGAAIAAGGVGSRYVGNRIRAVSQGNKLGLRFWSASNVWYGNIAPYTGF